MFSSSLLPSSFGFVTHPAHNITVHQQQVANFTMSTIYLLAVITFMVSGVLHSIGFPFFGMLDAAVSAIVHVYQVCQVASIVLPFPSRSHIPQHRMIYLKTVTGLVTAVLVFSAMAFTEIQYLRTELKDTRKKYDEAAKMYLETAEKLSQSENAHGKTITDLHDAYDEVVQLKREKAAVCEKNEWLEVQHSHDKDDVEELKELREELASTKTRLRHFTAKCSSMEEKVKDYDSIKLRHLNDVSKELGETKNQLAEKGRDCQNLTAELAKSSSLQTKAQTKASDYESKYRSEVARRQSAESELTQAQEAHETALQALRTQTNTQAKRQSNGTVALRAECNFLKTRVKPQSNHKVALKTESKVFKAKRSGLATKKANLKKDELIKQLTSDKATVETSSAAMAAELQQLKSGKATLETTCAAMGAELQQLKSDKATLETTCAAMAAELQQLKSDKATLEQLKSDKATLDTTCAAMAAEYGHLRQQLDKSQIELAEKNELIKQLERDGNGKAATITAQQVEVANILQPLAKEQTERITKLESEVEEKRKANVALERELKAAQTSVDPHTPLAHQPQLPSAKPTTDHSKCMEKGHCRYQICPWVRASAHKQIKEANDAKEKEVAELKAEIEKLEKEVTELKAKIEKNTRVKVEIDKLKEQMTTLNCNFGLMVTQKNRENEALEAELATVKAKLATAKQVAEADLDPWRAFVEEAIQLVDLDECTVEDVLEQVKQWKAYWDANISEADTEDEDEDENEDEDGDADDDEDMQGLAEEDKDEQDDELNDLVSQASRQTSTNQADFRSKIVSGDF